MTIIDLSSIISTITVVMTVDIIISTRRYCEDPRGGAVVLETESRVQVLVSGVIKIFWPHEVFNLI